MNPPPPWRWWPSNTYPGHWWCAQDVTVSFVGACFYAVVNDFGDLVPVPRPVDPYPWADER